MSCNSINYKAAPSRRIIQPAIGTDDLRIILDTPDRSTVQGKRDYAVLLLASFTGLRAVDIANLRFCNFDFKLLQTTLIYAYADTEMKRKAIEAATEQNHPLRKKEAEQKESSDDDFRKLYGLL